MSAALSPADAKRLATLRAEAALLGAQVLDSCDDRGRPTWILTRWHLCRECRSLNELAELLAVQRSTK